MIVMKYYENGNLYQYLERSNGILSWRDMIDMLWGIAGGLERIHADRKVHKNLHGGNLLIEDEKISTDARISDIGFYGPCNANEKLGEWITLICDDPNPSEISNQSSVAEEKRWKKVSQLSKDYTVPKPCAEAIYTSRPLEFAAELLSCH